MTGLFGRGNNNGNGVLQIPGVGGGISQDQMSMFQNAANESGLTALGMGMVDQVTGGLKNEDQVELTYHLNHHIAPNQVDVFFGNNPDFLSGLAELISLVVRKELYAWYSSGAINAVVNAENATEYATITPENVESALRNMYAVETAQQRVDQADMMAKQLIDQHKWGNTFGGMQNSMANQQQQWQQQQWQQQQMGQQQGGIATALGGFGASLTRNFLGLPPTPQYNQYGAQYPQQGYTQTQQPAGTF